MPAGERWLRDGPKMMRTITFSFSKLACQFLLLSLFAPCPAGGAAQSAAIRVASPSTFLRGDGQSASIATAAADKNQTAPVPVITATVVKVYPHDPKAFTQGLEFYDGHLYESTGRQGESTLRETTLETGEVIRRVSLPAQYFGEGLTIFHGKVYQLTWLSKVGFIYDLRSFRKLGEFHYQSEGWGLTHDDTSLILSDGTNKLQFIDPASFAVTRTIEVYAGNEAVANLNELEYIHGEIFANVWHSSRIARIDPHSGRVLGWIDLAPLVAREEHDAEDVLNGIAYDGKSGRLFVTGKRWSEIIEIKLESKPSQR
jgi:glutamine cyclotransferase